MRPITLLVGENSTGKSSFMASYMAMNQCFDGPFINVDPDFNLDPFELGSFKDIAHAAETQGNDLSEFKIGLSIGNRINGENYQVDVTFRQRNASPYVHKIFHSFDSLRYVEFERTNEGTRINVPGQSATFDWPLSNIHRFMNYAAEEISFHPSNRSEQAIKRIASQFVDDDSELWTQTIQILTQIAQVSQANSDGEIHKNLQFGDASDVTSLIPSFREVVPIAPIRSRPKRTYDPIKESPNPEGDHIPMVLMRLSKTNKPYWREFYRRLLQFGDSAGLFSDIRIKDYEDDGSSPFQVQFKVQSGKFINVMDVGYGVSQCLPVVTSILNRSINGESGGTLFLLQQPEVHLHPRAQAEIGNLVCNIYAEFRNRFIIETHSDFIVNRIRVLVRKGVIRDSDVSIIYFERDPSGNSAKLFNLGVDPDGNIFDAPNSYRDFFVAETDTVLGFRK